MSKPTNNREIQNLIRGAIALSKAPSVPDGKKNHDPNRNWKNEQRAQHQINKALALAKASNQPEEFRQLNKWIQRNLTGVMKPSAELGTKLTTLGLFPGEINTQGLAVELSLVSDRIEFKIDSLIAFSKELKVFEVNFLKENWAELKVQINKSIDQHGHSYWALEELIACEQELNGLEAMKSLVKSLYSSSSGANKYILYQIGVRNEPAQSEARFKENLKKRIESVSIDSGLKTYLKYRLFGELKEVEAELALILAAEQLTSDIDLLITSIKLSLHIEKNSNSFSKNVNIANSELIKNLGPILKILGINTQSQDSKNIIISDASDLSDSPSLLELSTISIRNLFKPFKKPDLAKIHPVFSKIILGITSQLSSRDDGIEAEALAKVLMNHNSFSSSIRVGDINLINYFPKLLLDIKSDMDIGQPAVEVSLFGSIYYVISNILADKVVWEESEPECLSVIKHSLKLESVHKVEDAYEILVQAANSIEDGLSKDTLLIAAADLLSKIGFLHESLELSTQAYFQNSRLLSALPLNDIFEGLKWNDIKKIGVSIELAVALDLYLQESDNNKFKNYKRYAVQEILNSYNCSQVSKLIDVLIENKLCIKLLEQFFDKVCDLPTIELLKGMENTRDVQNERIYLLRKLAEISKNKSDSFLSEAENIEYTVNITEGLHLLDTGRVYVDEVRLLNVINKELTGDFQRYIDLVNSGIGKSESFDDVLKDMNKPSAKLFQIPKSEADDLLLNILIQIQERFLFDPAHGLDIYLSRRIRHGEIAGLIRGPLEKKSLIGQRPTSTGNYQPPTAIVNLSKSFDKNSKEKIYAAFARFSESIDQLISLFRDEYFHVLSPEKTKGLFDIQINSVVFLLARSLAQKAESIEEFGKEVIGLLWYTLARILEKNKNPVEKEAAKSLNNTFTKLLQDLNSNKIKDEALHSDILKVSEELRNKILVISSWICVPSYNSDKKYPLDRAIDMSIAKIISKHNSFEPIVISKIERDIELAMAEVGCVNDVLHIAFENVYEHSGKLKNKIDITINYNEVRGILEFSIKSEISHTVKVLEKEEKLKIIRSKISKGSFGDARKDKDSGLFKLAAHVGQEKDTYINFNFIENSHFLLEFSIPITATLTGSAEKLTIHDHEELGRLQ